MTATAHGFLVREWRPFERNTLRGFLSLELPSGMIIRDCTVHGKNNSRWVGMPARPYEKDGAKTWSPLIEFASKEARDKFQACALAAFDKHLAEAEAL